AVARARVGAEERVEADGGIRVETRGPEEADGLELAGVKAHAPQRGEVDGVDGHVHAELLPEILVDDGHAPRGTREVDDGEREALAVLLEDAVAPRAPASLTKERLRLDRIVGGRRDLLVERGQRGIDGTVGDDAVAAPLLLEDAPAVDRQG